MAILLLWGINSMMTLYEHGYYWACIPAGLLVHSYLIVTVHDGVHKSITRTKFDRMIANICAALVFVPFAEIYRKYHLIHHSNTNLPDDPISPPVVRELYVRNRWLYILCECVPFLFTLYSVMGQKNSGANRDLSKGLRPNYYFIYLSIALSIVWFIFLEPSVGFIFWTLFTYNLFSVLRNWCEHMGTAKDKTSNTYWFPLGFGVGHHDLHHLKPNLSWLTLSIGLHLHERETHSIKALRGILWDKSFSFYTNKTDGRNPD